MWLAMLLLPYLGEVQAQNLSIVDASVTMEIGATIHVQGDFSYEGAGTFANAGILEVSGNLSNQNMMPLSLGHTRLLGATPQSLDGLESFQFLVLELDNATGLTLNQDVLVANELRMLNGALDLNGQIIELSDTALLIGETDVNRIFGSAGEIRTVRDLGSLTAENIANLGLELTTNNAMGLTTLIRGHAPRTVGSGTSIARYFEVHPTRDTDLGASLRLFYFPAELNGQDATTLALFRLNDGATNWTPAGGVSDVAGGFVEQTGIDALALLWTLSSDGTTSLDDKRPALTAAVYPNPLQQGETLHFSGLEAGTYEVQLFDLRGRIVLEQLVDSPAPGAELSLAMPHLAKGVYTLQLTHPDFRPAMDKLLID